MSKYDYHYTRSQDLFENIIFEIEKQAVSFAEKFKGLTPTIQKEEEIRIAVERNIGEIAVRLNINFDGKHEFTLLRGFVDSVYGRVFIEYKNPSDPASRLSPNKNIGGTKKVIEQVKKRFTDIAELEGAKGKRLLGIGFDGKYFVFIRYAEGIVSEPEVTELSRWSARRFLFALFNLGFKGKGLTPENLAEDFGTNSPIAQKCISIFSNLIKERGDHPQVEVFYRQWRILYSEVCGYNLENGNSKLSQLVDFFPIENTEPSIVFFALHTYYAVIMKLLTAHVLSEFQRIGSSPVRAVSAAETETKLFNKIKELENGSYFKTLKIENFLEGDIFSWYVAIWDAKLVDLFKDICEKIEDYNAQTLRDDPIRARDLLKQLYHQLLPKKLRHDLGEYYTPDWLAELTLDEVGYDGNPNLRLLDPSCGSGTFLVLALNRVKKWYNDNFESGLDERDLVKTIVKNIVGFELNPVAVLAARANYVMQIFELFSAPEGLNIPIFMCDSILTPFESTEPEKAEELMNKPIIIPTYPKKFYVPREVSTDHKMLSKYCELLSFYGSSKFSFTAEDFRRRCISEGIPINEENIEFHDKLVNDIKDLDRQGKNGLWPRYIRNAFAPVFQKSEPFDFIVGNPPWIGWESLPGKVEAEDEELNYRQKITKVFKRYGLFSLSGTAGRLGGGKKDLSMLFVYTCIDHFLKEEGKLGFTITQTIFKTEGAGDGFRRFEYRARTKLPGRPPRRYIEVLKTVDLSDFQSFEGATNRTSVFICKKSKECTSYPIPYDIWYKIKKGKINPKWELDDVKDAMRIEPNEAVPVGKNKITSPWLTIPVGTYSILEKALGKSDYKAYAGCCTWLNGVFWVNILQKVPDGLLINNLFDVGKIKVTEERKVIESDLVYPLLRGRDIDKWAAKPSSYIILTQDTSTRSGILEADMRRKYPNTYIYLKSFENELRKRSGYKKYFKDDDPFWSIYNVGEHTLSHWKVAWSEVGKIVNASVINDHNDLFSLNKTTINDHTVISIPASSGSEAYFICALLNSTFINLITKGYITLHPSPHVLNYINIPLYNTKIDTHTYLSQLSQEAHSQSQSGDFINLEKTEYEIDKCAARLWGITESELEIIRNLQSKDKEHSGYPIFEE